MVNAEKKNTKSRRRRDIAALFTALFVIVLLNFIGRFLFARFDLTSEKRYTLAESTRKLLRELDDEVYLKVYLAGDFDPAFTRLRNETRELLDEFRIYSDKQLQYEFIVPGEGLKQEEAVNVERQLYSKGLIPEELSLKGKEKITQTIIWPGAIVTYKGRESVWQLFRRPTPGSNMDQAINSSVEELEYGLTNTIRKLQRTKKAEVTFIEGHNELDTVSAYDFMRTLSEYYTVNRTSIPRGKELSALKGSDAIVIAAPDSAFTDREAFVIDQFIMRGGKVLWLIDPVETNLDSLMQNGNTIAINRPLNIEEMLFKYGVRLNPVLVQDLQSSFLNLTNGFDKGQPRFQLYRWRYFPVVLAQSKHPIVRNLDLVKLEYASTLDTITSAKGIKKTILLSTSRYTKLQSTPARIFFRSARSQARESQYQDGSKPVAVLLEGAFSSFVENRLPSALLSDTNFKYIDKGVPTKMIVVADGDVARNEYVKSNRQVFELGFDRHTQQTFANKKFLLNCMNYLLDDEGMLDLRSREVKLRLLDRKKAAEHRGKWQAINVAMPVVILFILGLLQHYLRRRRYTVKTISKG
jgi:ABC-2 type transport system permease protein